MRVLVGTSGFSYREWKGSFYPKDVRPAGFLRYYASRLPTVEINNTFYEAPKAPLVKGWMGEVPDAFVFAVKAPRTITHSLKLAKAGRPTRAFVKVVSRLGPRLGPLLFQLPPFFQKDVARLDAFLRAMPPGPRVTFEFRHASWFDDDVWATLRAHGAALCVAEGEELVTPLIATADWGYVRLRKDRYSPAALKKWALRLAEQPWKEAFVYIKHDDGDAPGVATRLARSLERLEKLQVVERQEPTATE